MKKLILFFISLISFILVSCSNNQKLNNVITEQNTIKSHIIEKESEMLWTDELESDILRYSIINDKIRVPENNTISPNITFLDSSISNPVYPYIEDFDSLDLTKLPDTTLTKCKDLLKELCINPFAVSESYFEKTYLFSYIFFCNDIKNNYKNYFQKEYPLQDDETEDKNKENKSKNEKVFTSYIIGAGYSDEEISQIPVRLYKEKDFIDINLFIKNSNNLVYNIVINNWSRNDER